MENIYISNIFTENLKVSKCCLGTCSSPVFGAIEWELREANKKWINHYCAKHIREVTGIPDTQK